MEIKNKLDALHAMANMRRMEIDGRAYARITYKEYDAIYAACERYFKNHPSKVWDAWENNTKW